MKNIFLALITLIVFASESYAQRGRGGGGGGSHSLEFALGLATASQEHINSWIVANSGQQLSSGYEFSFTYHYRFSGTMYVMALRPSYFDQRNTGSATAALTAISFMPMLRMYPLENDFIKFFLQIGMGFSSLSGTITKTGASASFSGSAFGMQLGLGADFCFTSTHCMTIEGNYRYMPVPRSTITASSGAWPDNNMSVGGELEYGGLDAQNTLSGIQGLLAYTIRF